MHYAITGPRTVTMEGTTQVLTILSTLPIKQLLFGDAKGVDAIAHQYARQIGISYKQFFVGVKTQKSAYAIRSMKMIDSLKENNGTLIAFPNKQCPVKCTPKTAFSGHGSGTWGTIAYARKNGLGIRVYPIETDIELPDWLSFQQLTIPF